MSRHNYGEYVSVRLYMMFSGFIAYGFVWLWCYHPMIAAVVTAVLFVLGLGLLTSKVIFRFENPKLAWGLAPVFGGGWFFLFWMIWVLRLLD